MNKRHAREGEDQELADLQEGGQAKKLKQEDCKCSRARVVRAGLYPSFCCVDCDRNLLTGAEVNDLIAEEYRPDHPLEIKTLAGALAGVIHQSAFAWGYLQVMLKAMAPYMTDSGTWPANKELLDVIYQWLAASQVQAPFLFTEDEFVELLQELETMPNIRAFFPTQRYNICKTQIVHYLSLQQNADKKQQGSTAVSFGATPTLLRSASCPS
jgi:hypothetical protein